jgi:large subunit ribosomal protein L24
MSKWLRKGDRVVVITGNEKGKSGNIRRRVGQRVVVEDINMRKKHVRPTQENPEQRIVDIEGSLHISNVRPCDQEGKAVKLRVRMTSEGGKELIYKSGNQEKVYRMMRASKMRASK